MLAMLRKTLASPAGLRLFIPLFMVTYGIQRLVELAGDLEADVTERAERLGDIGSASDLAEQLRILVLSRDGYAAEVDALKARLDRTCAERDRYRSQLEDTYPTPEDLAPLAEDVSDPDHPDRDPLAEQVD